MTLLFEALAPPKVIMCCCYEEWAPFWYVGWCEDLLTGLNNEALLGAEAIFDFVPLSEVVVVAERLLTCLVG